MSAHRPELRVAVVGISERAMCGVRDQATLLSQALPAQGLSCSTHWLDRGAGSPRAQRAEILRFTGTLRQALEDERPQAVVLHYSVFAYGWKGLPVFVAPVLNALGPPGRPVVGVLHEFVYPWGFGGWRGPVWAASQRVALRGVVRRCSSLLVTAEWREDWMRSRRWLPRRPVALAPVFSNLPDAAAARAPVRVPGRVGLFGFAYQGVAIDVVLDAVGALRSRGATTTAELRLLGAPGADSAVGHRWLAAARERGLEDALSFSGPLPAQELADELAACSLLLSVDAFGPSSRRSTLAASLASGVGLVALDGRLTWRALQREGAARVVAPNAEQLARAAGELLEDPAAREALGAAGRAFYEHEMAPARQAQTVAGLIRDALADS